MCDSAYWEWEPLVEVRFTTSESSIEYNCLCSRSVVWPKSFCETPRNPNLSGSDDDDSDDESNFYQYEQLSTSENIEKEWLEYWSVNGDKIIWDSWVDKYRDYISPDYLTNNDNDNVYLNENHNPDCNVLSDSESGVNYCNVAENQVSQLDEVNESELDDNDSLSSYCSAASSEDSFCTAKSSHCTDILDFDSDYTDDYWSTLWKQHCETEYNKYYQLFISFKNHQSRIIDHNQLSLVDDDDAGECFEPAGNDSDENEILDINDANCMEQIQRPNLKNENHIFESNKYLNFKDEQHSTDRENNESMMTSLKRSRKAGASQKETSYESAIQDCDNKINNKNRTSLLENSNSETKYDCSINDIRMENLSPVETESVFKESTCELIDYSEDEETEKLEKELLDMDLPLAFGHEDNKRKQKKHKRKRKKSPKRPVLNDSIEEEIQGTLNRVGLQFKHSNLQNAQNQNHNWRFSMRKRSHIRFDHDGNIASEVEEAVPFGNNTIRSAYFKDFRPLNHQDNSFKTCYTPPRTEKNLGQVFENGQSSIKRRKSFRQEKLPSEIEMNSKLKKYYYNRYSLFSKFDEGILLDEQSWYSVTPEEIAKYTAERCKCEVIVDAFCGAGGNTIQFALNCDKVIAIDIDPQKIELAKHNAKIYGVFDKIEFHVGDFFEMAHKLKADVVFLSPPWGGPDYLKKEVYDLVNMLEPKPISDLLGAARKVSNNIAIYLPRNSDIDPLVSEGGTEGVEIEQNFLGSKLMAITAFFSKLKKKSARRRSIL